MVGEYFTSVLSSGIFNEIMSKVFTYNVGEANRNGEDYRGQTLKTIREPL